MKRGSFPGVIAACILCLHGASAEAGASATPITISIDHFVFEPGDITIEAGDSVTWVNRDQTIHNILSKDGKFASPGLDTGDRFTFRFGQAGEYPFFCGLHPHMVGIVHVKARQ